MNEREIFTAALATEDRAERVAFLNDACAGNAPMRQRVESLLAEHQQLGSFMDAPSPALVRTIDMPAELPIAAAPGTQIGPYKILQQIGEGGMGVVYLAEQAAPVRRKVALKIIKPGMDTREVIARFEAERQALALMDHPNIARVFDGGATEVGRPYFVMELVRGVPITDYCDQNNLPVHERLELFVTVCHAVQHAHQKGIIHRDIKPSNVLVTMHDGRPVPKVIDFGVAKAIGQQLTDKTLFTQFAQMVGTPLYMSPEQAELTGQDVDTRGDIYSLGVLLYELLTGTTPLEKGRMKRAAMDEIRRMIREEEPASPSTRLSSTAGQAQTAVAAHRRVDPKSLSRLVRGDLDWIVMKALEKDRTRRYETANGFAADIGRYLSDEPVEACPPSSVYRFRKFVRRNRAGLVTASLLAVAGLVATIAIGWTIRDRSAQQAEMDRQRVAQQFEVQRERAAARQKSEQDRLARQAKLEVRVSEELREAQAAYDRDNLPQAVAAVKHAARLLAGDDFSDEELRERVRHWQGELEIVQRLDDLALLFRPSQSVEADAAYASIFRELEIDIDELPVEEAGKRIRSHVTWRRLTEALDHFSAVRDHQAHFEKTITNASENEAIEVFELGMARKRRVLRVALAADSDDLRSQVRRAVVASDLKTADRLAAAPEVTLLAAATLRLLAMVVYNGGGNPRRESAVRLLENAHSQRPGDFRLSWVCAIYYQEMNPPRWAEAVHYWSIALAIRPTDARVQALLAYAYHEQGKMDEAITGYRRAIELDPNIAMAHNNLGVTHANEGRVDEAIACFRRAIEVDPKFALSHTNLGDFLRDQGKLDEAICCHRRAIELNSKFAMAHNNLGRALHDLRKFDEAIACHRRAIELDPKYAWAHNDLGLALQNQRKFDEAIACYRRAIESDPKWATPHTSLGVLLETQGKPDEAIACFRQAIQLDPKSAVLRNNLGTALMNRGKPDEAIVCFHQAIEIDPKSAPAHNNLGTALRDQGKPDEAAACFRQGIELDPKSGLAYYGLGSTLKNRGQPDEAIACYRQAIQLDPNHARAHTNLGLILKDQGKLDEAIACYRQATQIDPKLVEAHFNLGVALNAQGKTGEAIVCYRQAIALDPKFALARNDLADALKDQGKLVEAIAWYRQAIELDPKSAPAHNNLGTALKDQGKPDEAIDCFRQAIDFDPKYPPAHSNLGTALAERGNFDEAVVCFRQVTELDPKSPLAHNLLGAALKDQGNPDEAVACYRRAIELDSAAWNEFVDTIEKSGRLDESEKFFGQLIAIYQKLAQAESNSSRLTQELALLLVSAGRVTDTLAVWEKLVDDACSNDDYRLQLGHTLWELADQSSNASRYDEAEKTLYRALDVFEKLASDFPGNPFYRVEQGFSQLKLGWLMTNMIRSRAAEEPFRQAVAIYKQLATDDSKNPFYALRLSQSHKHLAEVLVRQGKDIDAVDEWGNAATAYTKAIALNPDDWDAWNGRAFVHFSRQQWDEAIADFSEAIHLAPHVHTNWWHRGHAYINLAQWDNAVADFGKVVEQWPEGAEGWYRRGLAWAQLNQPDKAMADLRQAIAKGFNDVEQIKNDPNLDPLRNRDDFRKLMKELIK